LKVIKGVA